MRLDEAHHVVDALAALEVREHERARAALSARIALHDLERRADVRSEVDLVDHEQIRAGDAGAALARDLVAGRDVDDVDRQIGKLGRKGRRQTR